MDVLQLSDGTTEIVGSTKDFSEMLDRKLGSDVRDWFDENFSQCPYMYQCESDFDEK